MKGFFTIILLVITAPFILYGAYGFYKVFDQTYSFARTQGIVIKNTTRLYSDGTTAYVPVVKFLHKTDIISFTDEIGSIPAYYNEGDSIQVMCDPNQPEKAYIYSFKRVWFEPLLFVLIGLVPLSIFLILMRRIDL